MKIFVLLLVFISIINAKRGHKPSTSISQQSPPKSSLSTSASSAVPTTSKIQPLVNVRIGPAHPQDPSNPQRSQSAYVNGSIDGNFNMALYPCLSCVPSNITVFKAFAYRQNTNDSQTFELPISITNKGLKTLNFTSVSVKNFYKSMKQNVSVLLIPGEDYTSLQTGDTMIFEVVHVCPAKLENSNYWSIIELDILFEGSNLINLQYQFLCDPNYHPVRFDWSTFIMIVLASGFILVLARFGTIYSFKAIFRTKPKEQQNYGTYEDDHLFQGIFLGAREAIIYFGFLMVGAVLNYTVPKAEKFELWFVYGLVTILTAHFFDELLSIQTKIKWIKRKVFLYVRICDIVSLGMASLLTFLYLWLSKPWFLSDLLSICLMGSLIKLFKISSLKDSISFLGPFIIMNIITCIYLAIYVRYEWDNVAMKYFDTPLSVQIPLFLYAYKKKCGWVSVLNILFPGFFLGFVYRFDVLKKTYVYEIIGFFGLLIGFILWFVAQYLVTLPLPVSFFTIIPMIGMTTLLALQRNELKPFWTGGFYDEKLFDPFKDYLDIQQDSIRSIHIFQNSKIQPINEEQDKHDKDDEFKQQDNLVGQTMSGKLQLDQNLFQGLGQQSPTQQQQQQHPFTVQQNQTFKPSQFSQDQTQRPKYQ